MKDDAHTSPDIVPLIARTICRAEKIDPDAPFFCFKSGEKEVLQRWQLYIAHAKDVVKALEAEGYLDKAESPAAKPRP